MELFIAGAAGFAVFGTVFASLSAFVAKRAERKTLAREVRIADRAVI